jgi:hypothetical protein
VTAPFFVNSGALIAGPALDQLFGIVIGVVLPGANSLDDLRDEPQRLPVERSTTHIPIDL